VNDRFVTAFEKTKSCGNPHKISVSGFSVTGMTRMTGFFDSRMCACVCITNHICLSYLSLKEIINWKA